MPFHLEIQNSTGWRARYCPECDFGLRWFQWNAHLDGRLHARNLEKAKFEWECVG